MERGEGKCGGKVVLWVREMSAATGSLAKALRLPSNQLTCQNKDTPECVWRAVSAIIASNLSTEKKNVEDPIASFHGQFSTFMVYSCQVHTVALLLHPSDALFRMPRSCSFLC